MLRWPPIELSLSSSRRVRRAGHDLGAEGLIDFEAANLAERQPGRSSPP